MISITKAEKDAIIAKFPDAYIVKTMKRKSKRHHYYCEERSHVVKYLNDIRNNTKITTSAREGVGHTD